MRESAARPSPVQAVALKHDQLSERLAARPDRFSQLLSRLSDDQLLGRGAVTRSGLSEAEHREMHELTLEAHQAFRREMQEAIDDLRSLLSQGEALYTLAIIQGSNLIGGWGAYYEPTHPGLESNVEVVAGLLLTQPRSTVTEPLSDPTMQAVHDHLKRLADLALLRNLTDQRDEDSARAELRFMSQLNWMTVRGSSFVDHGRELAREIFRPFDRWSLQHHGFTIDDVLAVADQSQAIVMRRLNSLRKQAQALAAGTRERIRDHPDRESLTTEQLARLDSPEFQSRAEQWTFIHAYQAGVREATSFTPDELVTADLPQDRVEAVLRELALPVGALAPDEYRGPFDKSPLVEHPFIEVDGRYMLLVPGMVIRDAVVLLEDRFLRGPRGFSKSRAKTLDRLSVEHLMAVLPGSRGLTNLHYEDTELDGLVLFERTAFVVEGKASALSTAARRGDLVRLGRDLGRAVQEAWEQGARARRYLLGDDDAVFRDERGTEVLRLPAGSVDEVHIINPTLHELAGHAAQLPRLRSLGMFPAGEYPWSVFINDLRVISETADNAAVFLHYLTWRSRLPLGARLAVLDELDLWGCYLCGEQFESLAAVEHQLVGNSTTDFDAYYAGVGWIRTAGSQASQGPCGAREELRRSPRGQAPLSLEGRRGCLPRPVAGGARLGA